MDIKIKKNANNFSAKDIVIAFFFIIILGLVYFLYTYKKELDDLQASISEKTNSIIALESRLSSATASLNSALLDTASLKSALLERDGVIKFKDDSIRDLTANVTNYKKLCYYLLINEFVEKKMLNGNDIQTYYENNYGKKGDSDLYFIRDKYIPLIKEFTKNMNVSYEKFAFLEKVILDAIKNKEKIKN